MNSKFLRILPAVAIALLLAACTQDELAGDSNTLPEGKYPLEIASVTLSAEVSEQPWGASRVPQTRVAENANGNSSKWECNNTEKIGVQIGSGEPGTYTLVNQTQIDGNPPAYWLSTNPDQSIIAWYPAYEGNNGTVSLADQSTKLAYVLKATTTASFGKDKITLPFKHQLAKVHVVLTGDQVGKVTDVKISSYTSCTNTQGTISTASASLGWINMMPVKDESNPPAIKCWEANVVPDHKITEFQINETTTGELKDNGITPLAAKINTINLTVGTPIFSPDDLPDVITEGKYIVEGTGTKSITINGSPTITLRNVDLCDPNESAINIIGGTPTLIFEGNNTLITQASYKGGIVLSNDASVTIEGKGNDAALEIKYTGGEIHCGIGSAIDGKCGNITIKNMKLTITSHRASGIGSRCNTTCGDITIEDSELNITSLENSACIGASVGNSTGLVVCGNITVKNCSVIGSSPYWQAYLSASAVIGSSAGNAHCGNIDIYLKSGQDLTAFLSSLSGTSGTDKVGVGSGDYLGTNRVVGNITFYNYNGVQIATGPQK